MTAAGEGGEERAILKERKPVKALVHLVTLAQL